VAGRGCNVLLPVLETTALLVLAFLPRRIRATCLQKSPIRTPLESAVEAMRCKGTCLMA
jgi:hypothetical protein